MSLSINPEGKNVALIKTVKIISLGELTFIPHAVAGMISYNRLGFAAGASFEEIYHTPESASFNETEERTRSGSLWTKAINLSIPKVRSEIIAALQKYEKRQIAAIITDYNETSFLVFPLRLQRKKQIPGQFSAKNAFYLQLTGRSNLESPEITDLP